MGFFSSYNWVPTPCVAKIGPIIVLGQSDRKAQSGSQFHVETYREVMPAENNPIIVKVFLTSCMPDGFFVSFFSFIPAVRTHNWVPTTCVAKIGSTIAGII